MLKPRSDTSEQMIELIRAKIRAKVKDYDGAGSQGVNGVGIEQRVSEGGGQEGGKGSKGQF